MKCNVFRGLLDRHGSESENRELANEVQQFLLSHRLISSSTCIREPAVPSYRILRDALRSNREPK